MTRLPFNRFVRCGFYAPIQIANVRLEGTEIVGEWGNRWKDFYGEKGNLLAQQFANCPPDPSSILRFTERFGPLTESPSDGFGGFRFSLQEWTVSQRNIRKSWKFLMQQGPGEFFPEENILLEFRHKELVLQCRNLKTFMNLELSSCADKLRICEREGCKHPYFVPQHGKERYCSTDCSNWAQSQWKKRWHERQREKRIKKEKVDGTHKTR
jgi:hypothetical protein